MNLETRKWESMVLRSAGKVPSCQAAASNFWKPVARTTVCGTVRTASAAKVRAPDDLSGVRPHPLPRGPAHASAAVAPGLTGFPASGMEDRWPCRAAYEEGGLTFLLYNLRS